MSDNQFTNVAYDSSVLVYDTPFFEGVGSPYNGTAPLFQDSNSATAPNTIPRLLQLNNLLRRVVLGIVQNAAVYA